MSFKTFHGITLAAGSSIENHVIESLAADPAVSPAGRFWVNTAEEKIKFTTLDGAGAVVVRSMPDQETLSATLATHNAAVQAQLSALGNAFNYIGGLDGGATSGAAYDLDALAADQKDIGDYHKVTTSGYFTYVDGAAATQTIYANANDGLVRNANTAWDIIDNTNSTVAGTASQIAITGSPDTGYTVAIDAVFSGRMTTVEGVASDNAANIGDMSTMNVSLGDDLVMAVNTLKAANDSNTTAIATEATTRAAADAALQTQIDGLTAGSGTKAETLRTMLNARIKVYTAASASTSHVFNHTLTGEDLTVSLWVKNGAVWDNDSAAISMDPATTTVTVPLSTSEIIKLIVEDKSQLAAL